MYLFTIVFDFPEPMDFSLFQLVRTKFPVAEIWWKEPYDTSKMAQFQSSGTSSIRSYDVGTYSVMVGLLRSNALKEQQPRKQIVFDGCPQDGPLPVINGVISPIHMAL